MENITTLIFDLDGTLYTSRELAEEIHRAAVDSLASQLGLQPDDAARLLLEAKRSITLASGWEATLSSACLELGADLRTLHRHLADNVAPEPFLQRDERVVAMLKRLGTNYRLYLYTNNNRQLALRIMTAIGIEDCFRKVFSIEDLWISKPDKKAIEAILADIGATAAESLFIGDRYDVDLRLPAKLGGQTYLCNSVEELLEMERILPGFCRV
jgi:putative hydrolase of the HAD superfamily